jgi:hypothetical protein
MAEVAWALICDYAFLDQGGKACLIGVFDKVVAKSVPATHHQAAIVVQLRGEPGEDFRVRVELVRPTGGVLHQVGGPGKLNANGAMGVQLTLANVQLPDWGRYACNVYLDDTLSHTVDFRVDPMPASGKPS